MKWEPLLAMVIVIALGVWLVGLPGNSSGLAPLRPNARTVELRIGDEKGVMEVFDGVDGEKSFRFLFRDGSHGPAIAESELREILPESVYAQTLETEPRLVFWLFNITSWAGLAWIAVGLGGQLAFSCRFVVQWLVSEKENKSVVPQAFWWMSLIGGACLFLYFIWRQDIVGVLGQSSGLVIYVRNIQLIRKRRRRERARGKVPGLRERVVAVPLLPRDEGGLPDER